MDFDPEKDMRDRVDGKAEISESPSPRRSTELYTNTPITQDRGILSRLRNLEARLDAKLGVESEAITRKLPDQRHAVKWHEQLTMALLWASGTMNISCFATGFLGWEFGLSLKQNILIIIFGSLLGGSVTGYCATFGAAMGLRQMSVSRFSFGWYPNKLIAVLNTIQQLGWAGVACITAGLALEAVADGHLSLAVGVIIVALVSLAISFIGLRAILVYERYAWFIYFIIFMIIFGETGKYADNTTPASVKGADLSGAVLSLLAIIYGSSASWSTLASDYYVQYPVDVNRFKVFIFTALGISVPTSIGMLAGAVVASALNNRPDWKDAYENQGIGFLIRDMLHPRGFSKFLLVLLVLSGINVNILSLYSSAISCQQIARPFARIPRFIWLIGCFGVVLLLALIGRSALNTYLVDFLSLLGYWCTSYCVILALEHTLIRKRNFANYDLTSWNDPRGLPYGIAAFTAFGLGVVAWVMGMSETWYVGPLAKLIGTYGGDVGNEFTLVVTGIIYLPLRILEMRTFGK
jgi:NCS1 nucleoside transporter family